MSVCVCVCVCVCVRVSKVKKCYSFLFQFYSKCYSIVVPFFSSKGLNSNNILLVEGNETANDDGKIATIMNRYFKNITKYMNLNGNKISHREELVDIMDTFKNHKSAQRIKLANFHSYSTFSKVT